MIRTLGRTVAVVTLVAAPLALSNWAQAASVPSAAPTSCLPSAARASAVAVGIQWSVRTTGACARSTANAGNTGGSTPPSPSFRGSPPLIFHGGPVTGTSIPGELTVTPVYWVPTGSALTIPSKYKTLLNRFITDTAHDSNKATNVFSAVKQYTNASGAKLHYLVHAGTPIVDTNAYPTGGCTHDTGAIWGDGTPYSVCITNSQLLNEASVFTTAHALPNTDLAHLYVYFMPKGVETCFSSTNGAHGGTCSINVNGGFCGYHAFSAPPLVANLSYAVVDSPLGWTCSSDAGSNTGGNQSPNANIDADTEISVTSHEINETITDPKGNAWWDASGNENGDDCAYIYGDSASFRGSAGAFYNQTINAHHYFVQEEFSNDDYKANSAFACVSSEDSVTVAPASGPAATSVSITGSGFAVGESVKVTYATGLAAPTTVTLCTTTATTAGAIACSATIPSGVTAGAAGAHKIKATGATTKRHPTFTFTLS
jgi:hypothetical protein